jgi:capsular exopolysaccharide synthesis family protein
MKEQIAESKMHALDYWQVMRNRWGVILLTFFLVLLASLVIISLLDKKYVGRTSLQVNQISNDPIFNETSSNGERMNYSAQFLETQFKIITSRETLLRVVDKKNLKAIWEMTEDEAVGKLFRMIETQEERGTEIISIEVYSTKPEEAADLANAVREAYQERRVQTENERVGSVMTVLTGKQKSQETEVEEARIEMMSLMKQYGIVDTAMGSGGRGYTPFLSANAGILEKSQQNLLQMKTEVTTLKANLENIRQLSGQQLIESALSLGIKDATIESFGGKYKQDRVEYENLTNSGFGKRHPKVIGLSKQIQEESRILEKAAEQYRATLTVQIKSFEDAIQGLTAMSADEKEKTVEDKQKSAEYLQAKTKYEMKLDLLNQMRETFLKTQINQLLPRMPIVVHEKAKTDLNPARPNVPLLLSIGAGLGLILGLILAFFLEYLDTSVKTLDDVERYLGVPVLAVIPKDVGILHKQSGLSPDAEAYRILRTNIEFNRKSADANAITIVSGGAGEGKSTTLVNLAYICAQGGYNTLMIDGDLRRPKLHTFFDINNSVGLTNYLTTALQLEDVILQTPIENLYFMPSGILPADAAGILNSRRMSELIADVKNRFDLVLIDSPPILGVSDASVLASEVDLTIIVIQHRKLPRTMLMRVKQAIENVGGNLLGVVLNNVDLRSDSQYQYYTSYYTYYSPTNMEKARPARAAAPSASSPTPSAATPTRSGNTSRTLDSSNDDY